MMLKEDRVKKALHYLLETDAEFAVLASGLDSINTKLKWNEHMMKDAIDSAFLRTSEGTVDHRKALAKQSGEYQHLVKQRSKLINEREIILKGYHDVRTKRETEQMVLRLWQTQSANERGTDQSITQSGR